MGMRGERLGLYDFLGLVCVGRPEGLGIFVLIYRGAWDTRYNFRNSYFLTPLK